MRRLLAVLSIVASLGSILTLLLAPPAAHAAPDADLWARWQAHDADSTATIDHSAFDAFLHKYVVVHDHGPNGVRYGDVSAADRDRLAHYIAAMEKIDIDRYNRDVQRAYWINLYNAETIDLVLEDYPVDSIRDFGGGLFHHGPWDDQVLEVEGEELSLNDIEHRILRPIWPDGMTHYGVNCASISCPSLRDSAYTGANIDRALVDNAKDYVNSPEGVHFEDGRLIVSKIYDWYQSDFGGDALGVIQRLRRFAQPALSARLDAQRGDIDGYAYDWSLNSERNIERHGFQPDDD
ncbi:DUF547 domain-containing protein [Salinisphaera sp.]|uniref:DUF547 domain-containing protein n=1 Tax=Salinisphaera sp. TaxID=1914330 RepID=UPI002D76C43A|nr:DUF547 domain-containing protein [Salinisphaera sp.]HET7314888.1 DUF547 domain-containing protein [Salinisphaera sp.]